jgi:hypothetical protein
LKFESTTTCIVVVVVLSSSSHHIHVHCYLNPFFQKQFAFFSSVKKVRKLLEKKTTTKSLTLTHKHLKPLARLHHYHEEGFWGANIRKL